MVVCIVLNGRIEGGEMTACFWLDDDRGRERNIRRRRAECIALHRHRHHHFPPAAVSQGHCDGPISTKDISKPRKRPISAAPC